MDSNISLLGVAGSLRRGSINAALLRAALLLLPRDVSLTIYDLAPLPLYNGDLEMQGLPAPVRHFADSIAAADALVIATPEYNGGLPAILKNAIDWASRADHGDPLRGKLLAIMGASPAAAGTAAAQQQLRDLALATGMLPLAAPQVRIGHAWRKFASDGTLTDPGAVTEIHVLLEALVCHVRTRQRASIPVDSAAA